MDAYKVLHLQYKQVLKRTGKQRKVKCNIDSATTTIGLFKHRSLIPELTLFEKYSQVSREHLHGFI